MIVNCQKCGNATQQVNKPTGKFGAWVANECVSGCLDFKHNKYPLHTPAPKAPYSPHMIYPSEAQAPQQAPVQSTPPLTPEATLLLRNINVKLDTLIKLLTDPLEKEHKKQQDLKKFEQDALDLPDHPLPKEPF